MSGFLRNLMTRSAGEAPLIQPRLPTLFEPPAPYALAIAARAGWNEAPADIAEETVVAYAETAKPEPQPRLRRASKKRSASQPPPDEQPASLIESARPVGEPSRPLQPASQNRPAVPVALPQSVELRDEPASFRRAPIGPAPAAEEKERNEPERARNHLLANHADAPPVVARDAGALTKVTAAQQPPSRSADSLRRTTMIEQPPIDRRPATRNPIEPPPVEQRRISRVDLSRHVAPLPRPAPLEPAIQVTIGRVEVRALPAQGSSAKERPSSPVMGLNDYLRSKRGGA
jgi:hypothetical protein